MTTSTIIQTIVALGIVAVALVYVLRRVFKTTRGQGDCGCGAARIASVKSSNRCSPSTSSHKVHP